MTNTTLSEQLQNDTVKDDLIVIVRYGKAINLKLSDLIYI